MGNSPSHNSRIRRTPSYNRKSSDVPTINRKIDEKEYVFVAMQSEIEKAIVEDNREAMKSLLSEIAAHILDLNQLKQAELTSTNRGRTQKIIYNFELSLAKIKSISNYDTVMKKDRDRRNITPSHSSSFYVNPANSIIEPDIVSDLVRFDNTNNMQRSSFRENRSTLPNVPENQVGSYHSQLSRSHSLYSNQPQSFEEAFVTIESEFDVLKDQAERPVEDVNEYYQMDKGVFYLYAKIKNLELPESSTLNERKFGLIKDLSDFRTALDKKSGELEEQSEINQEINTLELLVDSASPNEIANLKTRALEIQESVDKISWSPQHTQTKIDILRRLARFLERIAYTSPSSSVNDSVGYIYGNLNSLQEEMNILRAKQGNETTIYNNTFSDNNGDNNENSSENELGDIKNEHENDESIYGNIEVIRESIESQISRNLKRTGSNVSQRGTVYINADIVRQNSAYENHVVPSEDGKMNQEVIAKRPLPLPRNYDDKMINDLPKHWQRLNEIFDQESYTDTDKSEVADIQRHAEIAKNLFERKIKRIMGKFEESVEL